jgi:MFS family permease
VVVSPCDNPRVQASLEPEVTASGGSPAEVWDRQHRPLTLGLILTISFTAFEALAVTTVLPAAVAEIGGLELYGWAFSGFVLASIVGISVAGHSADRSGTAVPFAVGAILFVAGLLGAGAAPTMPLLVAARAVQGLGGGALSAVAYATVGRGYGSAARPRMIALLSTAWVLPALVGPALAGAVADTLGWRWVFIGLAPPTIVGAALALGPLRRLGAGEGDDGAATRAPDRRLWSVVLAVGTGAFLSGLERAATLGSVVLVGAGIGTALAALARLLPAGSGHARAGAPAAIATMAILGFTFFGAEAFVPLALTELRGLAATLAGLPLTVAALAWTAGTWLQYREARRRSHRLLIGIGLAAILVGITGIGAILSPAVPTWVAGVAWGIASLGMGIAYSTATLVILERAPAGREGEASAALQLASMLGTALGTGLGGALLNAVTRAGFGLASGIAAVDAVMAAVAALGLLIVRRIRDASR